MIRINDELQLIMEYGENAFEYVRANFSIDSAVKKNERLYNV